MSVKMIFIHGNSANHWSFGWAAWLKGKLDEFGFETFFETFPDSVIARSEYWLPFLEKFAKADEDSVLIGWSSGAVAAMRFAEKNRIKGSILVSPSYTDLGDELEKESGYFDTPWDWEAIKNNQVKIGLFFGDNDPYIPQDQFEFIASKLNPKVFKIQNGGHFIDYETFPQLLSYIKETYT